MGQNAITCEIGEEDFTGDSNAGKQAFLGLDAFSVELMKLDELVEQLEATQRDLGEMWKVRDSNEQLKGAADELVKDEKALVIEAGKTAITSTLIALYAKRVAVFEKDARVKFLQAENPVQAPTHPCHPRRAENNPSMKILLPALLSVALLGCGGEKTAPTPEAKSPSASTAAPASASVPKPDAELGKPAPDFTLTDYEGKAHHLADYRGKIVVLEWFNPDCPFVKASHTKGSLKGLSKRLAEKGVMWIGINSGGPGKQGHGKERVDEGKKAFGLENVVVADENGKVGRMYGATNTPHMFVIDAQGTLVYRGAIDNSPDGVGESPTEGKLRNHVQSAVEDLLGGRTVQVQDTKAYGCSVKYSS